MIEDPTLESLNARLFKDAYGLAAMEFALISPVFLVLIFAAFDAGQIIYGRSLLSGATERAARESSLEAGDTQAADAYVERIVRPVLTDVTVTTARMTYYDFSNIDRPEPFNDGNSNGLCDNNEPYTDENSNGLWDMDVGLEGNGGAGDVVVYNVSATYHSAFANMLLPASLEAITLSAQAVRKNQPFANQSNEGTSVGSCA